MYLFVVVPVLILLWLRTTSSPGHDNLRTNQLYACTYHEYHYLVHSQYGIDGISCQFDTPVTSQEQVVYTRLTGIPHFCLAHVSHIETESLVTCLVLCVQLGHYLVWLYSIQ